MWSTTKTSHRRVRGEHRPSRAAQVFYCLYGRDFSTAYIEVMTRIQPSWQPCLFRTCDSIFRAYHKLNTSS